MNSVSYKQLVFIFTLPLLLASCTGSSYSGDSAPDRSGITLSNNERFNQDENAPSKPANLRLASSTMNNSASITWNESADDVRLSGYRVYRNGEYIAFTMKNLYTDNKLKPATTYHYEVEAVDQASNSTYSDALKITIADPASPGMKTAMITSERPHQKH